MSTEDIRYDAEAHCVYLSVPTGAPFEIDAARRLSKVKRSGAWQGKEVQAAEVRFEDATLAKKHADALSFLDIKTVAPDGVLKGATFRTRTDFGL